MSDDISDRRNLRRTQDPKRRRILQALGVAGVAGLSGCLGGDNNDDDGGADEEPSQDNSTTNSNNNNNDDTGGEELGSVETFGPDGNQVTLSLMHDPSGDGAAIAAQIERDLSRIGIDVELLESSNILQELNSEPLEDENPDDFAYGPVGRNAGPPDRTRVVNDWDLLIGIGANSRPRNPVATRSFWTPSGPVNAYGFNDEEVVSLYDEAAAETDPQARIDLIAQIFGRFSETAPANFINTGKDFFGFRPDINLEDNFSDFGYTGGIYSRYRNDQTVSGDYTVLTETRPQSFYPPEIDDESSAAILGNVADNAYALTDDNQQFPFTTKMENSGDSQVWVCTIRDNIEFGEDADGNALGSFTAEDWVYQINNVYGLESNPWNEDTVPSAVATEWNNQVENVEQTGEFEFQIELPEPNAAFFTQPTFRNRYILPKTLYEKYVPDAQALRQSTEIQQYTWTGNLGPYELASTTPGETGDAIFERNDDYYMRDHVEESNVQVMDDGFAEAPYFERLLRDREPEQATLNERWRAGDGDSFVPDTDIIEELQQRDDTTVAEELSPFISMMFFNMRANGHPMLKSAEGRIAINSIVDKQVIVEDVKRGLEGPPAATYQPRWSQFYDDSLVTARGIGVENADVRAARDRIRQLDGFSVEEA